MKPIDQLTFDDLLTGDKYDLGTWDMTRDAAIAFSSSYDPQPFHLDDAAAAAHPLFSGIPASGWHTVVIMHNCLLRFLGKTPLKPLAGGGVDEIKWMKPVYPGDHLSVVMEIIEARPLKSKPDRGALKERMTVTNQAGEAVATMVMTGIYERCSLARAGRAAHEWRAAIRVERAEGERIAAARRARGPGGSRRAARP